jgi:hypothetical protein
VRRIDAGPGAGVCSSADTCCSPLTWRYGTPLIEEMRPG